MARVTVALTDIRELRSSQIVWQTDYSGYTLHGPLGNASNANVSAWAGATRYITRFKISSFRIALSELNVQTQAVLVSAGAQGQDLPASWEDGADTIQVSCPGLNTLILPGPNNAGNTKQDAGEQYAWRASAAKRTEIGIWITAFRALPVADRNATLTLDDDTSQDHAGVGNPIEVRGSLGEASGATVPPLALRDWPVPSGQIAVIRALIEVGSPDIYNHQGTNSQGTLLEGDLTLVAGQDLTRIRNAQGNLRINDQPSGVDLGAQFGTGGIYENAIWYLATLDDEESLASSVVTSHGNNYVTLFSGAIRTLLNGLTAGDRFILGLTVPGTETKTGAGNPIEARGSPRLMSPGPRSGSRRQQKPEPPTRRSPRLMSPGPRSGSRRQQKPEPPTRRSLGRGDRRVGGSGFCWRREPDRGPGLIRRGDRRVGGSGFCWRREPDRGPGLIRRGDRRV